MQKHGSNFSVNQSVVATTTQGQTQKEGTSSSAHNGSVINTPQLNNVNIYGSLNNNTFVGGYAQPPARTDETGAVSDKSEENFKLSQDALKSYLLSTTKTLPQGTEDEPATPLNKIYTELYIIEGGSGEVNNEHEVIDLECTRCTSEERKIHLHDIFKPSPTEKKSPQRVLTKGIAGIGKTVAVQKFTRDWADGTANQAFPFVFPFTFRELNLLSGLWSLWGLIKHYFEEEGSDIRINNSNVLFIFDGLDESQFPLNFGKNGLCRKITKETTIDALLTNLIEGKLLHKASVWITSRPASANKIPLKHIDRVTEVRGFNDEQKTEYFLKTISDQTLAWKILDHLQSKSLRSLHIMCHIPLFCWISGRVLQYLFKSCDESELPKNLTEMYTHFLIIQTQWQQQKDYQEGKTSTDVIMELGRLAFEQLQKGNIIFHEKDLKDCQIDLKQVVHSGVCTQIIRKEKGVHKQEFYSFIHLSVQEFLAALYVQESFMDRGENPLATTKVKVQSEGGGSPVIFLHKNAVRKALDADDGRWDLFLRFLLGLSQETNQKLLQKVLGPKERPPQSSQETINYIHEMIRKLTYTDKSINLFHCLNELGDQSLVEQVQNYQSSGDIAKMSPSHWSALAFVLLVSNEDLSVFDLKKYHRSDEVLERLLRVLKASKTALLSDCELTDRCCKCITSVLGSPTGLEELDLSRNPLHDSGMRILCEGLRSPNCQLQKLWLLKTKLQSNDAAALVSALLSNPSHIKELHLSSNDIGDDGVKEISALLKNPNCKMEALRLEGCRFTESGCATLASSLKSNPAHLRVLNLGRNNITDAGAENLSKFLEDPLCQLEILNLKCCSLTPVGCQTVIAVLSNSPSLKELDLSYNLLENQGLKLLSDWLQKPLCRLEILRLMDCALTAGFQTLIDALSSTSALEELDLRTNHLEEQEWKLLSDWHQRTRRLKILRLPESKESSDETQALVPRSKSSVLRERVS